MRVQKAKGQHGGWEVWDGARFIGHYATNRAAWDAADRLSGEVRSRSQDVSDWVFKKDA